MKKLIHIDASFDHPDLLVQMIEQLACRRNTVTVPVPLFQSWIQMQTSSTEAFASGTVDIKNDDDIIHHPFTTHFLFTCHMSANNHYRLTWSMGMN